MHILLFILFFGIIILVYKIAKELTKNEKLAILTTFLYAVSATHFGQLYFLATQEIIYGFFFFLAVWLFIKYLGEKKNKFLVYSFISFLLTLASKEPAVTIPFVLGLITLFVLLRDKKKVELTKIFTVLSPFFVTLTGYLYMRFFHYGFAKGDSYLWVFEPIRILNSLGWYGLWSLNIPEMLVDFVGPGLNILPSLLKHYSKEILPIFTLFALQLAILPYMLFRILFKSNWKLPAFSGLWFIGTLIPVLFLPIHKFSFYLTVPLFGVVLFVSHLLLGLKSKIINLLFITAWISLSVLTLNLTAKVSWITRGEETVKNVYNYFSENEADLVGKTIVFIDTPKDKELPWSPTETVKVALSNGDFFEMFYPGKFIIKYEKDTSQSTFLIQSRQFLGY
jgi:hypothetical protein